MDKIQTDTGMVFSGPTEALTFIREQLGIMLDPGIDIVASTRATTDFLYTFSALDDSLSNSGLLPNQWAAGR